VEGAGGKGREGKGNGKRNGKGNGEGKGKGREMKTEGKGEGKWEKNSVRNGKLHTWQIPPLLIIKKKIYQTLKYGFTIP
jgi:hypothetical protein